MDSRPRNRSEAPTTPTIGLSTVYTCSREGSAVCRLPPSPPEPPHLRGSHAGATPIREARAAPPRENPHRPDSLLVQFWEVLRSKPSPAL